MSTPQPNRLVRTAVIFFIFLVIAIGVRIWINHVSQQQIKNTSSKTEHSYHVNLMYGQLATISFYCILSAGFLFILPMYGIDTITILGTVGLAIGLASQNVLNNVLSGIFILANDTYRIDDIIKIQMVPYYDSTGNFIIGKVKSFNLFYTKLSDLTTNNEISIPNGILYGNTSVIENQAIVYQ